MKNLSIIALIFIIPIAAYFLFSKSQPTNSDAIASKNKPQIIKFTSLMCVDCKKLSAEMKEVYPKYSDKITLVEIQVQNNDEFTKKQIEKHNITLVPTLIFLDSKGRKVSKVEGFLEKDKLEQHMKELD